MHSNDYTTFEEILFNDSEHCLENERNTGRSANSGTNNDDDSKEVFSLSELSQGCQSSVTRSSAGSPLYTVSRYDNHRGSSDCTKATLTASSMQASSLPEIVSITLWLYQHFIN